jgi:hypothetical protein
MNRPGVRFTITLHNELEDIDALIEAAKVGIRSAESALEPKLQRSGICPVPKALADSIAGWV